MFRIPQGCQHAKSDSLGFCLPPNFEGAACLHGWEASLLQVANKLLQTYCPGKVGWRARLCVSNVSLLLYTYRLPTLYPLLVCCLFCETTSPTIKSVPPDLISLGAFPPFLVRIFPISRPPLSSSRVPQTQLPPSQAWYPDPPSPSPTSSSPCAASSSASPSASSS